MVGVAGAVCALVLLLANLPGRPPLPQNARADSIRVDKEARTLELWQDGRSLREYQISLGSAPLGHKLREGDERTPEGRYLIDRRNSRSAFHLALHISYPDRRDVARAAREGVPPGGDIMIHGMRNGAGWVGKLHLLADWTDGCIAVTNREIEEIWRAVPDGTPIRITR